MRQCKTKLLVILMGMSVTTPSWALFGEGDITFDPQVHAQLVEMYNQGVELYKSAKESLQTLSEVNETIYEAQQAYDAVVNFNLHDTLNTMFDFQGMRNAKGRWKINALLGDLNRMEESGRNTGRFFQYQMSRFHNLEKMLDLQEDSVQNAKKATEDIPERQSNQITAQSTASMAALMASRERREEKRDIEKDEAAEADRQLIFDSRAIYKGLMGHQEGR